LLGPVAVAVDGPGDQLLARPALALDEDGALAHRHAGDRLVDLRHGAGMADQHDRRVRVGVRRLPAVAVALELLDGPLEGQLDLVELEGLGDVLERAALHGVHGGVHGAEAGHHDVERLLATPVEGLFTAVGLGHLVPPLAEDFLQHEAVLAVIFDEEDPDVLHRFPGTSWSLRCGPNPQPSTRRRGLRPQRLGAGSAFRSPAVSRAQPSGPALHYLKIRAGMRAELPLHPGTPYFVPMTWLICFLSSKNLSLKPCLPLSNVGLLRSRFS